MLSLTGLTKGTSFYLEGKRAVIGRSDNVGISILDPKASRQHAEIVKYEDSHIITDLKSQNGVVVNDLKIAQHKLTSGDRVVIGSTVFKYDILNVSETEVMTYDPVENNAILIQVLKVRKMRIRRRKMEKRKNNNDFRLFFGLFIFEWR